MLKHVVDCAIVSINSGVLITVNTVCDCSLDYNSLCIYYVLYCHTL